MLNFRRSLIIGALRKALLRLHCRLAVMLACMRWHVAYALSLRHIGKMMQERAGDTVDFLLTAKRDMAAVRRFLERAREDHHRQEWCQHSSH